MQQIQLFIRIIQYGFTQLLAFKNQNHVIQSKQQVKNQNFPN